MGTETLFEETMAENFFNLINETDIQDQVAQKIPNKMNPKRLTPRHNRMKTPYLKRDY